MNTSSERSDPIQPSWPTLARRLGGGRRLAWLAGGGSTVMLVALWLATSSGAPDQTAVEVPVPPPAARNRGEASPNAAMPPTGGEMALVRPGAGNVVTVSPVAADAFDRVPPARPAAPLPPAPDTALVEVAAEGSLPRRGSDGRLPWQAYARPSPATDGRARIAVIVAGLGASAIVTREIVRRLPADVTLAFEPVEGAADWGREARAAGHEIMLALPVQGDAFPFVDRGPEALAADVDAAENRARLRRFLPRLAGYVGGLAVVGAEPGASGDQAASKALDVAAGELAQRGLLLVTPVRSGSIADDSPQLGIDLSIAAETDGAAATAQLAALEQHAKEHGHALAVVEPTPANAEALAAWVKTLPGKAVVLAPVSAVAQTVQTGAR